MTSVTIDVRDHEIADVKIEGGCAGWRAAAAELMIGRSPLDVSLRLANVKCGERGTSCAAEIAKILETEF